MTLQLKEQSLSDGETAEDGRARGLTELRLNAQRSDLVRQEVETKWVATTSRAGESEIWEELRSKAEKLFLEDEWGFRKLHVGGTFADGWKYYETSKDGDGPWRAWRRFEALAAEFGEALGESESIMPVDLALHCAFMFLKKAQASDIPTSRIFFNETSQSDLSGGGIIHNPLKAIECLCFYLATQTQVTKMPHPNRSYSRATHCWMCAEDLSVIQFGADGFKECPRPECRWRASREQLEGPPRRAPEQWMFNLLDHDSDDESPSIDRLRNSLTQRPITEAHLRVALVGRENRTPWAKPSELSDRAVRSGLGALVAVVGHFVYRSEVGCYKSPALTNTKVDDVAFWRDLCDHFSGPHNSTPVSALWNCEFKAGTEEHEIWLLSSAGHLDAQRRFEAHARFSALARRGVMKLGLSSGNEIEDLNLWLTILRQQFGCTAITHAGGQRLTGLGGQIKDAWKASSALCEHLETEALADEISNGRNQNEFLPVNSAIATKDVNSVQFPGNSRKRDRSKWKPEYRQIIERYENECSFTGRDATITSIFEAAGISQRSNGYAALRGERDGEWLKIKGVCLKKPHLH